MLSLTRNFVFEELRANVKLVESMHKEYVLYFTRLAEEKLGTQTYWSAHKNSSSFSAIDVEIENLLVAVDAAYEMEMWSEVRNLVIGIVHILWPLGLWEQRIQAVHKAIQAVTAMEMREDEAWFRVNGLALIFLHRKEFDKALAEAKIAQTITNKIRNIDIEVASNLVIANVLMNQGEYERAEKLMLQLLNVPCSPRMRGYVLNDLVSLKENQGDYASIQKYIQESIKISRELGNVMELTMGLVKLGAVYLHTENIEQAEIVLNEAINSRQGTYSLVVRSLAEWHLGIMTLKKGNSEYGKELLERSFKVFKQLGMQNWKTEAEKVLAQVKAKDAIM